ncbi:hypothetical protein, partial [Hungatella effluvii]|uniref:hypothetical protein n=1 Tax=Hungatella effluvii TaxID=1096246 RepID=UPI003D80D85B
SPLMQWCGLKLRMPGAYPAGLQVTTDAVVWIEIRIPRHLNGEISSPLMQWCGLKFSLLTI